MWPRAAFGDPDLYQVTGNGPISGRISTGTHLHLTPMESKG
jgi:hypothetical protein